MHGATAGREQAGVCHIHGVGAGFLQIRIQQHDLLAHAAKGQSHGAVGTYMPGMQMITTFRLFITLTSNKFYIYCTPRPVICKARL